MALIAFALLASVASAAPDRTAQVHSLLFELCPKVVASEVDLTNAEHLAAAGLRPRTEKSDWLEVQTGEGQGRITIAYRHRSNKKICVLRFGGRDNTALFRSIVHYGEARGWRAGPGATELGGLVSFLYAPPPATHYIMFMHWDEFDGLKPATNAGLVVEAKP